MFASNRPRRMLAALAIAASATVALATSASAAPTQLTLDCQADAPVLGPQATTLMQGVEVTAPETVAPGAPFDIVIAPGPVAVPADVNGIPIKEVKNLSLRIPIPENITFDSAELSGGDIGEPTITVDGQVATLFVAGPYAGGGTFTLPTVTAHVVAGTEPGVVETHLGGTSYEDPALTLTTTGTVFTDIDAPTACFPVEDPVLSTTTIA